MRDDRKEGTGCNPVSTDVKTSLFFAIIVAGAAAAAVYGQNPGQASLVLTDVTVIDATGAAPRPEMMVVVTGDRITSIEEYRRDRVPPAAQVIDGYGKFVIPGLWDMHVHWYDERYLPLFVANGVTGVRQMWGMPMHQAWRPRIASGTLVGPQLSIASPIIDGPQPIWPSSVAVGNADEARAAVVNSKKGGADFIKVYNLLPRDAYFAIVDEAKKQQLPFVGHVPTAVSIMEASDAGQKSIEHLTGVMLAASSREAEFRTELVNAMSAPNPSAQLRIVTSRQAEALLTSFDNEKATAIYERLVRNHTWQVPTLTVLRSMAWLDDPAFLNDPRLKYMPQTLRAQWDPANDFRLRGSTPEEWATRKKAYAKDVQIVGDMHRQGVDILAGTDVLNPYCFPGFSLHDELGLLVSAGLTPMEAIQAATRNVARYFDGLDSFGTVEAGKTADLVVLDADPLSDIHNTQRIGGVVMRGRYFPRAELDRMLASIEAIARGTPIAAR